jgi:hypothetical protein
MASIYDNGGVNPFLSPTQDQLSGIAPTPSWGNQFNQYSMAPPPNTMSGGGLQGINTPVNNPQAPVDYSSQLIDLGNQYQAALNGGATQSQIGPGGSTQQVPGASFNEIMGQGGLYGMGISDQGLGGNTLTVPAQATGSNPQAGQTPGTPTGSRPPGAFGNAMAGVMGQVQGYQNVLNNVGGGTGTQQPQQFNQQQQNWMNANSSGWGDDLMKFMLGGGGSQMNFDPMNIQWQNFNNGATENITRALGVLQNGGGDALAKLLGGKLESSPFATFGTQQRDQFIRMPNGQMIDASAMANSLKGAMGSSNPFSSLSDVIGLYQRENQNFNPQTNTDAINLVQTGVLDPRNPPNWDPSKFAGGNPTYTPSGPVPGNPSNPGMGTSNPIQFQGGQIDAVNGQNGFPIFNYSQPQPGLPNNGGLYPNTQTPQQPSGGTGGNTIPPPTGTQSPTQQAPQGSNSNWQYYMNSSPRNGLFSSQGLYAQSGGGTSGGGGGMNTVSSGAAPSGSQPSNPFAPPKPSNSAQTAGNLPNGSTVLGK